MDYLNWLINLAQILIDNGFEPQDFMSWKNAAFGGLLGLLGPFHYYTQTFKRFTSENTPLGLLTGRGILIAAREEGLKADDMET